METARRIPLHFKILLGLAVGAVGGLLAARLMPLAAGETANGVTWFADNVAEPIGKLFLNLIFMVVVPLVFSALVLGVAEIGDVRKLGRMGLTTLAMTLLLSGCSVAIGLTMANVLRPGDSLGPEQRQQLKDKYVTQSQSAADAAKKAKGIKEILLDLVPRNPLQEMVGAVDGSSPGGGMLAVMVFAPFVGVAITLCPIARGRWFACSRGCTTWR